MWTCWSVLPEPELPWTVLNGHELCDLMATISVSGCCLKGDYWLEFCVMERAINLHEPYILQDFPDMEGFIAVKT
jgi:hypothetical protein